MGVSRGENRLTPRFYARFRSARDSWIWRPVWVSRVDPLRRALLTLPFAWPTARKVALPGVGAQRAATGPGSRVAGGDERSELALEAGSGAAHPTLTIVALAHRLADHLGA